MQRHAELERFKKAEAQTKLASCHVDWEFYCSATKKDWIISMTIGDTDSPTALIDTRVQEPSIHMDQVHPGVFQQLMPTARRMAHDDPIWGGEK
jgi:hypothetical protein